MEEIVENRFWLVVALCLAIAFPIAARAQAPSATIVGVWKVKSVETREVVSSKAVRPFGDEPTGTFVFTRGGHMVGMQYGSNRKAPASADATQAEKAALMSSMSAYSGTYRVDGSKLVIAIEDSSIQSWNGSKRTINIEIEGNKLTGTSEPFKSLITGLDVVAVVVWERLE
jgi:hypothetical protein